MTGRLVAVCLAFVVACSDESRALRTETTTVEHLHVTIVEDERASFGQRTYDATLGDMPIVIARIDATHLAFITPSTLVGTAALEVTADGTAYAPLTFTIEEGTPVGDPVNAVAARIETARQNLMQLDVKHVGHVEVVATLARLRALLDQAESAFTQMTPDEQQVFAAFLERNELLAPWLVTSGEARLVRAGVRLAVAGVGVALAVTVGGPVGAALTVAAAFNYVESAGSFTDSLFDVYQNSFERLVDIFVEDQPMLRAPADPLIRFTSGQPDVVTVVGVFRTLGTDDRDSPDADISELVETVDNAVEAWRDVDSSLAIGSAQGLGEPPLWGPGMELQRSIAADELVVEYVSNAGSDVVSLDSEMRDGSSLTLTFSWNRCDAMLTGPRAFAFVLLYTSPLGEQERVTVSADVVCPPLFSGMWRGTWSALGQSGEITLALSQSFQNLSGTVNVSSTCAPGAGAVAGTLFQQHAEGTLTNSGEWNGTFDMNLLSSTQMSGTFKILQSANGGSCINAMGAFSVTRE